VHTLTKASAASAPCTRRAALHVPLPRRPSTPANVPACARARLHSAPSLQSVATPEGPGPVNLAGRIGRVPFWAGLIYYTCFPKKKSQQRQRRRRPMKAQPARRIVGDAYCAGGAVAVQEASARGRHRCASDRTRCAPPRTRLFAHSTPNPPTPPAQLSPAPPAPPMPTATPAHDRLRGRAKLRCHPRARPIVPALPSTDR
jgi:hypothetical protein